MPNTCSNCRHWHRMPASQTVHVEAVGQCRYGPPAEDFRWPRTKASDHCSLHNQPALLADTPAPRAAAPEQTQPTFSLGEAPPATVGKTPPPAVRKTGPRSASVAPAKTATDSASATGPAE